MLFENESSTAIVIACMKKDFAKMKMVAVPKVNGDDEEIKAPTRPRSAIVKILKIHNSPNTIKPQDIEEMEQNGALDALKVRGRNHCERYYCTDPRGIEHGRVFEEGGD